MRLIYSTFIFLFALLAMESQAQCIATVQVGNYTANGSSFAQQQIHACNFAGDYAIVNLPAGVWVFSTSVSTDFITITDGSNNVLETGTGNVQFGATTAQLVRMHIFQNAACDQQTTCRTSYVQQTEIPVPEISASDTFICFGEGPVSLSATNLFGDQTYWYTSGCSGTPIDSGSSTTVSITSTTTYYANNYWNGTLGDCDTFVLTVTPNPVATFSSVLNVLCHGDSTASISTAVASGSSPFEYVWNTGDSTSSLSNLDTGFYEVIVIDSFGCDDTASVTITQPDPLTSSMSILSEPLCNGDLTGSAQVVASGGVEPYSYFWPTGAQTALVDSLGGGQYILSIFDSNGCLIKDTANITEPNAISIAPSISRDVDCHGNATGASGIVAFGGTGTLAYDWSNGGNSPSITGLSAGVYTASVTDDNNCLVTYTDTISQPDEFNSTLDVTDATCLDSEDGVIMVTNSGGTQPYSYLWDNGETGNTHTELDTGTYMVTITDDSGCVYIESAFVDYINEDPIVPLMDSMKLCAGFEITLDAGNAGSSYDWSTGDATQSIQVGVAGFYTVVVTDGNGCTGEGGVAVYEEACVGISENSLSRNVSLFPNPTQGMIRVSVDRSDPWFLQLYSVEGRLISTLNSIIGFADLDLRNLDRGIYLVQVQQGDESVTRRIVLQ